MSRSPLALLNTRRLGPLAIAQACGALNDNLVKNAIIVLALFKLGVGGAGLSALAGALFIAPYIVLSATAGIVADRFPKARVIIIYKAAEVILMMAAAVAFYSSSLTALLVILLGLGVQAALFGPVKYGVLPELLGEHELVAGNGLIEAMTFLSIVAGTVAGGSLILLDQGVSVVGSAGIVFAVVGLLCALRIPRLPAADPSLRLSPNLPAETWRILRPAFANQSIRRCILALSWFWTIGATLLTELPVLARDTMHAEGTVLALLLAVFAIGVGVGSIGCARLLAGEVSPRLVPYAALGISVFCWDFASAGAAALDAGTVVAVLSSLKGWRM
ncbi:MAG TPA: MFS transporter, partial [Acetobacteraceae bacterium]